MAAYGLLRRSLRRLGLAAVIDFRIHQVIAIPPWQLALPERQLRGMSVRWLTPGDVAAISGLRQASGHSYAERFARNEQALGAFLDQRLVAFLWLKRGPAELQSSFGCRWQISPAMVWLFDLYSDPAVLGAVPRLYAHLRQALGAPGGTCHLLMGQNEIDNLRSRWAHRRLGYRICATIWTLRLGGWQGHLSRAAGSEGEGAADGAGGGGRRRRWRQHRHQGAIPLHLFAAPAPRRAARAGKVADSAGAPLRLQCVCGQEVALAGERFACGCGAELGSNDRGLAQIGPAIPYWGEIPERDMQAVLAAAAERGWREAVERHVPGPLRDYVASTERAAFRDLLPLPRGARILDAGAGWGAIATTLAQHYDVTALEGVELRARFIALRAQQEGLARLRAIRGDVNTVPLALGQFDAIVANGVLEWVALLKTNDSPQAVQLQFLDRLRSLLRPGGVIYLAIENRIGWSELRGTPDHSGLPFTSLLPRPLARWVCAHSRSYRAHFNVGYRTYTYTHRGYRRLFRQVGLDIAATWISPSGYNRPSKLVPLHTSAIRFAQRATAGASPPAGLARRAKYVVRQDLRALAAHAGVWRWLGSDFIFLLRPAGEAPPAHTEVAHA